MSADEKDICGPIVKLLVSLAQLEERIIHLAESNEALKVATDDLRAEMERRFKWTVLIFIAMTGLFISMVGIMFKILGVG